MSLCPILRANDPELNRWLDRQPTPDPEITQRVQRIIEDVRNHGPEAVLRLTRELDAPNLESLFATEGEINGASLSEEEETAILEAIDRVTSFHDVQMSVITHDWEAVQSGYAWRTAAVDDNPNTGYIGQRLLPVESVAVYAPGGKATYPSSIIMNAVPAQAAGVSRLTLITPPQPDGTLPPAILFTARVLGIKSILKTGGALAVAAAAFGWEDFPRHDMIVGPGNPYLNEAKRLLWGAIGTDSYASTSEVAVIAFRDAPAEVAAADLLTQLEHSPDNVGLLFCMNQLQAEEILREIEDQITDAPREEILRAALANCSAIVICDSPEEAFALSNRFAPEHLSLLTHDPDQWVPLVTHAGCLVLGLDSPQVAGDFVAGPSHTLPTDGAARFASPLNCLTFLRVQSLIHLHRSDLERLDRTVQAFGRLEGFPTHAHGMDVRKPF